MTPRDPLSSRVDVRLVTWFAAASVVLIITATLLDWPAAEGFIWLGDKGDANRMFRVAGYLPLWLLMALAMLLVESARVPQWKPADMVRAWSGPILLALGTSLSGLLAEVGKLLFRRERPNLELGHYTYRTASEGALNSSGLGVPSSHTAIAFGATWMLCRLYPRASPVWLFLAVGCGVSRVGAQSHFLSDTVVSALIAFALVRCLWNWHLWNRQREELAA